MAASPLNHPALAALAHLAAQGLSLTSDEHTLARYGRSTSPDRCPPVAVAYPTTTQQVQQLVRAAREANFALHPISGGCNWGYGDACPPQQGQVLVDFRAMKRILEVNAELGYAVIEPGVTQGQLYNHLRQHNIPYTIDATGAGPDASFVGNTLERGFGHTRYGDHTQTTCGMQVVLGDGRILNTGYTHYAHARSARVFPYGIGPQLDGLFAQSSMGIVTQLGIWLLPESEDFCAFVFRCDEPDALSDFIERLAPLRRAGVIQSAVHMANDLRLMSARTRYPWDRANGITPLPDKLRTQMRQELGVSQWTGCGAIAGPPEIVKATRKTIRSALGPHRPIFLNDRRLRWLQGAADWLGRFNLAQSQREQLVGLRNVYDLLKGEPNGDALNGTLWRVRDARPDDIVENPLDHHAGLMWVSPVLPMTGHDAQRVRELLEPTYYDHGFEPLLTFTMINERSLIAVSNLYFDQRQPDEARNARACYEALMHKLIDAGYPPYRTGRSGYAKLARHSTGFWDVVADLKNTLDPSHVISPGRYEPHAASHQTSPTNKQAVSAG